MTEHDRVYFLTAVNSSKKMLTKLKKAIIILPKCDDGIMQPASHFREPVCGVNRCEYRHAVSCPSRFPEDAAAVC